MASNISVSQKPNTLSRVFKNTVQRVPCEHKQLSSYCIFIALSERLKKAVIWVGKNSLDTDLALAQSLMRKILYFELKQPPTSPILTVNESGEVLKGTSASLVTKDSDLRKHMLSEKSFSEFLEILWVDQEEYLESGMIRDRQVKNNPVIFNYLTENAAGNFVLVEMRTIHPTDIGSVEKLRDEFFELTTSHVFVIRIADEWDIWFGQDVSKENATKAKATVAKLALERQTLEASTHEGLLFGRNIRIFRQNQETALFKAYFVEGLFPNDDMYNATEFSCVNMFERFLTCFVPAPKGPLPQTLRFAPEQGTTNAPAVQHVGGPNQTRQYAYSLDDKLYKSNLNNQSGATMSGGANSQQTSASGVPFGHTYMPTVGNSAGTVPAGSFGGPMYGNTADPFSAGPNTGTASNVADLQKSKAQTLDQLATTSPSVGIFGIFSKPGDSTNTAPVSTNTTMGSMPNSTQNLVAPGNSLVAGSLNISPGVLLSQPQQIDLFVPPQQKVESNFWINRQKEYLANQKRTAAKLAEQVDINPEAIGINNSEEAKVAGSNFDKQVIGDLQTQHLHALPLLKKEEIAKRLSPFIIIPELNVRVEHARYITTLAAQDPRVLHGWQVEVGNKGLFVVTDSKRGCFGGIRFLAKRSQEADPLWFKFKLKPNGSGHAVKVLRKTTLCADEQEACEIEDRV